MDLTYHSYLWGASTSCYYCVGNLIRALPATFWRVRIDVLAIIGPGEWHDGTQESCRDSLLDAARSLIGLSGCGVDVNETPKCAEFVEYLCTSSTRRWKCGATTALYRRAPKERLPK
jgi:hypothetical protein